MQKRQLEYFRGVLTQKLDDLREGAGKTIETMNGSHGSFPDPTDRASLESDRNFVLRIRDRERKLISKIEDALARIEDGSFGICEMCGKPISTERLKVRPVTTLCIECKEKQEDLEKVTYRG